MLVDELREKIKSVEPDIKVIQTFWENSSLDEEFKNLTAQSNEETFWQNPQQADILKRLTKVRLTREQYLEMMKAYQELPELIQSALLAATVLEHWGVRSTSDIGNIVYNLIAAGDLEETPSVLAPISITFLTSTVRSTRIAAGNRRQLIVLTGGSREWSKTGQPQSCVSPQL